MSSKEVKNRRRSKPIIIRAHRLNFLLLIISTPIFLYVAGASIFLLVIAGFYGKIFGFFMGITLGELLILIGFVLSFERKTEYERLMSLQESQAFEKMRKSEILMVVFGVVGFIIVITLFVILVNIELDFW